MGIKDLTLSERIARAEAATECEKIMALHCYWHAAGVHREEIDCYWATDEKITWSHNFGQVNNMEDFKVFYVDSQEQSSVENYESIIDAYPDIESVKDRRALVEESMHFLVTPIVEAAEDAQSVKGVWYTPGCIFCTLTPQKAPEGTWIWERYAADFVKKDGRFVYKNLKMCCDLNGQMDEAGWAFSEGPGAPPPPDGEGDAPMPPMEPPLGISVPGPLHYELNPTQTVQKRPFIPQPYKTYAETYDLSVLTGVYETEN